MSTIDSKAVGRGALAGLLVIVPLTAVRAVLDHDVARLDRSGWVPLFALALFLAYVIAGVVAFSGKEFPLALVGDDFANGPAVWIGAAAFSLVIFLLYRWAARLRSA